jgi:large subunit ribosomal protein L35
MPHMPKQKTHKGLAKRFKVTAQGKIKFRRAGNSHLSSHKSGQRVRHLRQKAVLGGGLPPRLIEKLRPIL